jgi:glycerol uptake facilitator-like aquaporin
MGNLLAVPTTLNIIRFPTPHSEKMTAAKTSKKLTGLTSRYFTRELTAELLGTFILVFVGTGAVMVDRLTEGAISHLGISLVFGAIVAALIYTFGHISAAHFNPAVTLAFWRAGVFPGKLVLPYIIAQFAGAAIASFILLASLGKILLTFILMLVILGSGLDRRAPSGFAGISIGLTVAVEAAVMAPITGASMNPARSFGPALAGGLWQHQWLYLLAPIIGAQLAVVAYRILSNNFRDCKIDR